MNFIDRYNEELKNQPEEESSDVSEKILEQKMMDMIFAKPQKTMAEATAELAENMCIVAEVFRENLKGKYTLRQITDMVCYTIEGFLTPR